MKCKLRDVTPDCAAYGDGFILVWSSDHIESPRRGHISLCYQSAGVVTVNLLIHPSEHRIYTDAVNWNY